MIGNTGRICSTEQILPVFLSMLRSNFPRN